MIAVAACIICLGIMPIAFSAPKSLQSASRFLQRDAMQARSLLSCSVHPSARHVRGSRQND